MKKLSDLDHFFSTFLEIFLLIFFYRQLFSDYIFISFFNDTASSLKTCKNILSQFLKKKILLKENFSFNFLNKMNRIFVKGDGILV